MNTLKTLHSNVDYDFLLADMKGVDNFEKVCRKSQCLEVIDGLYIAHISGMYIKKEFGEIADLQNLKDFVVYAVLFSKISGMPNFLFNIETGKYIYHFSATFLISSSIIPIIIYEAKEVLYGKKVEFESIRFF